MISIRRVNEKELDGVKKLISSIFPGAIIHIHDGDILLLAEHEGKAVGFAHLVDSNDKLLLKGLGVIPEMRNRGVGTLLLESVLDATCAYPFPLYLKVKSLNPAIELYARHGFSVKRFGEDSLLLVKQPEN